MSFKNAKSIDREVILNQMSQLLGRASKLNEQDDNPVSIPQQPNISPRETNDNKMDVISDEPILSEVAKGVGNATTNLPTDKYSPKSSVGNNTEIMLCDIHTADKSFERNIEQSRLSNEAEIVLYDKYTIEKYLSLLTNIPQNQSPASATKNNLRSVKQIDEGRYENIQTIDLRFVCQWDHILIFKL